MRSAAGKLVRNQDFSRSDDLRAVERFGDYYGLAPRLADFTSLAVRVPKSVRGSVIELINSDYDGARSALRGSLTMAKEHEMVIADYIRDVSTAEATVANLRLQNAILYLTLAAVLLAIIALAVGIMPEDAKRHVWHVIAGHGEEQSQPASGAGPTPVRP